MFTGLVEEIGVVQRLLRGEAPRLTVAAREVLVDTAVGDSIAVNGVCLTVATCDERAFGVDVMPETLRATNLSGMRAGSRVNLERAVTPTSRMGGHFVQGHADGVGEIVRKERERNALWVWIESPVPLMRYIVSRGFIAVDGASLTVARLEGTRFALSLVPHTQAHITLPEQPVGSAVNLEVDIIAKYVERMLRSPRVDSDAASSEPMDERFLARHGFL